MADLKFQKLTPTDETDISGYEEGFQYIFENKDVRNIAIFGPYASGKSSILKTYEKKYKKEKKFIHISLAHFRNCSGSAGVDGDEANTLEGKIINHLITQIPPRRIPYTRFEAKRGMKKLNSVLITVGIAIIIVAILYFTCKDVWYQWIESIARPEWSGRLNFTMTHGFQIALVLLAAVAFFYGIYRLILLQVNNRFIKKLSIHGNEIELFSNTGDSYFDKYLREILYLFSRMKAQAVVFEDIERFDYVPIFERLREINTLVNYDRKQPIKFFYLLKDDIFTPKDRGKFFDYIMPIVPVINGSNAHTQLKAFLDDAGVFEKFDDNFLGEISLYFDDIRIIKTIVNEFVIFSVQLKEIDLNYNKLLAIMAYKNLFPRDYVLLQQRKGYVFNCFKEVLEKERKEIKDHVSLTNPEAPFSLTGEIMSDSEFEKFNGTVKEKMCAEPGGKEQFARVCSDENYALLAYLLREGFIDETYNDYITLFHPNDITQNDKTFLRGVMDRKPRAYNYPLNDPERVFKNLAPRRFEQREVLNYDLTTYLVSSKGEDEAESLSKMISHLSKTNNTNFVTSFFGTEREQDKFVQCVNQTWPVFFSLICKQAKKNGDLLDMVRNYSLASLLHTSDAMLENVNENACLSDYIASQTDYLKLPYLSDSEKETLIHAMKTIGVRFAEIDEEQSDLSLLTMVYQSSLYILNEKNLVLFLRLRYHIPEENEAYSKCLTAIYAKPEEELYNYIMQNPEEAMNAIFKLSSDSFCDDEKIVISFVNDEKFSLDTRKEYLSRNQTKIGALKDIQAKELYQPLLTNRALAVSVENIYCYYLAYGFTETLAEFVNSATRRLNYGTIEMSASEKQKFLKAATKSQELDLKHYKEIVQGLKCTIPSFDQVEYQAEKVIVLIQEKQAARSEQNLNFIRDYCHDALKSYIITDFNDYLATINTKGKLNSHIKDIKEALLYEEIPVEDRMKLFKMSWTPAEKKNLYLDFTLLMKVLKDQSITDQEMKRKLVQNVIRSFDTEKREQLLIALGGEDIAKAIRPHVKKNVAKTEPNRLLLEMLQKAEVITKVSLQGNRYVFSMVR